MNEIVMGGERNGSVQQTKLSFTTVFPSVQLHCKVMDINLFKGWGFLIDAILRICLLMICTLLHLLLVFCFPPPNRSKRFCCLQLFWKAIETRPRTLLVFILWLIQISVTFYAGKNLFFCQQVQWLPRWLNLRCWSRTLLVGLKRLVGYGWKVIVEWDWFCSGWRLLIVLLLLRGGLFGVERVVGWGWEIGWLGLRDLLVGVERLVWWGW